MVMLPGTNILTNNFLKNMNKLYYFVSLLIIAVMLSGCRSEVLVKPTPALKKLLTITDGFTDSTGDVIQQTTGFEYNSDGKLSKVKFYSNDFHGVKLSDTTSYIYSHDTVYAIFQMTEYYINSYTPLVRDTLKWLFILDSHGFISKRVVGSIGNPDHTVTYLNDNNGNCTKMAIGSGALFFKYSGGNMDSYDNSGLKVEYTYYPDKINTIRPRNNEWLDNFDFPDYFIKENKNLIKTEKVSIPDSSNYTAIYNYLYTYEFDANNYVTKRIMTSEDGTKSWEKYTYQ